MLELKLAAVTIALEEGKPEPLLVLQEAEVVARAALEPAHGSQTELTGLGAEHGDIADGEKQVAALLEGCKKTYVASRRVLVHSRHSFASFHWIWGPVQGVVQWGKPQLSWFEEAKSEYSSLHGLESSCGRGTEVKHCSIPVETEVRQVPASKEYWAAQDGEI
jgi:hypothetical protein